jgi:hypothetical protein
MVGNIVHREVAEPIFREMLKDLDDERLEHRSKKLALATRDGHGPYEEDEWHCSCIQQECAQRAKPEIFLHAENNILAQLRKSADH